MSLALTMCICLSISLFSSEVNYCGKTWSVFHQRSLRKGFISTCMRWLMINNALSTAWIFNPMIWKLLKVFQWIFPQINHSFFKNIVVLLVLFEARTENSATSVPRSMTEENLRDLINLLHNLASERQHFEEIAECGLELYKLVFTFRFNSSLAVTLAKLLHFSNPPFLLL